MQNSIKKFRTKLSTQFAAFTTMLIAITVFCIALYSISTVNNLAKEMTEQSIELNKAISATLAQTLGEIMNRGDDNELKEKAQSMVDNNIVARISIKNKNGKITPLTKPSQKYLELFKENKISKNSLKKKDNPEKRTYKEPVKINDEYDIELEFYNEPIAKIYLDMLRDNMLAMVFIFIFLGFVLSNFISGILIKPINILIKSLDDFAKGNFSHRLEESNYLEINRLIRSYNDMAGSLEKLYQSLEQQVKDRTKELDTAYTELKNTQAMMVHSEKMKSLGELVAGITHEINNPVNFIYGNLIHLKNYTEDLMSVIELYSEYEPDLSEEHKKKIGVLKEKIDINFLKDDLPELIRSCQEGTERTKNIVLDLKNFSRLEEAVINNVDLPKEIETTLNILHNKFKNKITVHKEYQENMPNVEAYGGQINQVFMNILDNAAFAVQDKGDVWIRLKSDNNSAIIQFEDNGCGMDEKTKNKVFDPFYTTKEVGQGTGLGMAISYKVIKNHGGEINIESELGKGSIFTITLPLKLNNMNNTDGKNG
jgi:signal transduction histidine kinase